MKQLTISQGRFRLSDRRTLFIPSLSICCGESWAFVGANGSGKSALARALSNELRLLEGKYKTDFNRIIRLSFEQLQKLVDEEWQRNNTDLLSPDEDDTGRTTQEIILEETAKDDDSLLACQRLAEQFGITHLLQRRFKYLSTGETRKTLLCRILISSPDLLVLDEPFDGLDVDSRRNFSLMLKQLNQEGLTIVVILNRFDDIPEFIDRVGVLADCHLTASGEKQQVLAEALVAQLAHAERLKNYVLPEADSVESASTLEDDLPRVVLRNGYVHYNDRPIINGLDWRVEPNQHWQIVGPNGAGKSTLLSLVTGDHPQGYSNDLTLFGRRRGSGETIWDIKRHIGYVSSSLHLDYRVNISVGNVILSGYFDSIGVYQASSDRQQKLTREWLALLGLEKLASQPFHSLSWGQQRLVLIARALVKHPTLLILDEPLQGLDPLNRQIIRSWVDILIKQGRSQLLFVSHHAEDAPDCITHRLSFIPNGDSYIYQQEKL